MRVIAGLAITDVTTTVIATRGDRLALSRARFSLGDPAAEPFTVEILGIAENDAQGRIAAHVVFDADDIDAALEDLDARYLAGEAAAHSRTWAVVKKAYAALNRHELAATTRDWINVDHRQGTTFAAGDLTAYLHAAWEVTTNAAIYAESVHRLSECGAVLTHVAKATSNDGFEAEWRETAVYIIDGGLIDRCELFDGNDLDAALARFEELQPHPTRLENAASQTAQRFLTCFAARDWPALTEMMVADYVAHDHRRVVNAGVLRGRGLHLANMRVVAELGFDGLSSTAIATRGECLALIHIRSSVRGFEPGEDAAEMLGIIEVGADNRIIAGELFDSEDIDAAFGKLDARYFAGEAAAHQAAWSVIAGVYSGFNRHELPAMTSDWTFVDHRSIVSIEEPDLAASIHALWEQMPEISINIESVHRLNDLGAVITHTAQGVSGDGLDVEWRAIHL